MLVIDDTQRNPAVSPICKTCVHLLLLTRPMCHAFPEPDAIPDEIWSGKNDHTQPYPGDHDIRYEHFAATAASGRKAG